MDTGLAKQIWQGGILFDTIFMKNIVDGCIIYDLVSGIPRIEDLRGFSMRSNIHFSKEGLAVDGDRGVNFNGTIKGKD